MRKKLANCPRAALDDKDLDSVAGGYDELATGMDASFDSGGGDIGFDGGGGNIGFDGGGGDIGFDGSGGDFGFDGGGIGFDGGGDVGGGFDLRGNDTGDGGFDLGGGLDLVGNDDGGGVDLSGIDLGGNDAGGDFDIDVGNIDIGPGLDFSNADLSNSDLLGSNFGDSGDFSLGSNDNSLPENVTLAADTSPPESGGTDVDLQASIDRLFQGTAGASGDGGGTGGGEPAVGSRSGVAIITAFGSDLDEPGRPYIIDNGEGVLVQSGSMGIQEKDIQLEAEAVEKQLTENGMRTVTLLNKSPAEIQAAIAADAAANPGDYATPPTLHIAGHGHHVDGRHQLGYHTPVSEDDVQKTVATRQLADTAFATATLTGSTLGMPLTGLVGGVAVREAVRQTAPVTNPIIAIHEVDESGDPVMKDGKPVVEGYYQVNSLNAIEVVRAADTGLGGDTALRCVDGSCQSGSLPAEVAADPSLNNVVGVVSTSRADELSYSPPNSPVEQVTQSIINGTDPESARRLDPTPDGVFTMADLLAKRAGTYTASMPVIDRVRVPFSDGQMRAVAPPEIFGTPIDIGPPEPGPNVTLVEPRADGQPADTYSLPAEYRLHTYGQHPVTGGNLDNWVLSEYSMNPNAPAALPAEPEVATGDSSTEEGGEEPAQTGTETDKKAT
jgi:hypothetical protein